MCECFILIFFYLSLPPPSWTFSVKQMRSDKIRIQNRRNVQRLSIVLFMDTCEFQPLSCNSLTHRSFSTFPLSHAFTTSIVRTHRKLNNRRLRDLKQLGTYVIQLTRHHTSTHTTHTLFKTERILYFPARLTIDSNIVSE